MKKIFLLILLTIFTFSFILSQSITVSSPSGGTWYKGTTHNITWTATGCSSANYKINIFRGSISVAGFVEQLTQSGSTSKNWTIPMGYTSGTYYIRVKTDPDQTGCLGDSAAFMIADPVIIKSVNLTSPNGGEAWTRYYKYNITWTSTGLLNSGYVNLFLYKGSDQKICLIKSVKNTGTYQWEIVPQLLSPINVDSGYKIKIVSKNDLSLFDYSDSSFSIIKEPATGTINVIRPRKGALIGGITYPIKWKKEGFFKSDSFVIDFYQWINGSWNSPSSYKHIKRLATNVSGSSFSWKVPKDLGSGPSIEYSIRVSTPLFMPSIFPERTAYSERFWIADTTPDLLFEKVKMSRRATKNDFTKVTFKIGIVNMGIKESLACNGSVSILKSNNTILVPIKNFQIPPLVYGENRNIIVKVNMPVSSVQYRYKIELDVNNANSEGNEDNNVKWGTIVGLPDK